MSMGEAGARNRDDRFSDLVREIVDGHQPESALTDLAQRYSYVLPDDATLSALAGLGALVEIGAGTGYWAHRLRALGVDVVAFDQAPPEGERSNRYHGSASSWTEVISGDHTVLSRFSDRALLLCWPPLYSSLGESPCYYGGTTVAVIGDGGHRTARLRTLNDTFTCVAVSSVQALEPFPGRAPTLSIWRRRPTL